MRIISIYTIKRTESYGVDFINVNLFLEKPYAAILYILYIYILFTFCIPTMKDTLKMINDNEKVVSTYKIDSKEWHRLIGCVLS